MSAAFLKWRSPAALRERYLPRLECAQLQNTSEGNESENQDACCTSDTFCAAILRDVEIFQEVQRQGVDMKGTALYHGMRQFEEKVLRSMWRNTKSIDLQKKVDKFWNRLATGIIDSACEVLEPCEKNVEQNVSPEPVLTKLEQLIQDNVEPKKLEITRKFSQGVLANAFLGNFVADPVKSRKRARHNIGGLDLYGKVHFKTYTWIMQNNPVATTKVVCMLSYFAQTLMVSSEMASSEALSLMEEKIVWEKISACNPINYTTGEGGNFRKLSNQFFDIVLQDAPKENIKEVQTVVHTNSMEGVITASVPDSVAEDNSPKNNEDFTEPKTCYASVNFANQAFGYGRVIASATQEEILVTVCPELMVGMLFYGDMESDAVVLTHNIRRYADCTGYGKSFQFHVRESGSTEESKHFLENGIELEKRIEALAHSFRAEVPQFSVISMDAVLQQHCTNWANLRDVQKAYLGFAGVKAFHAGKRIVISSGKWGCGAFFGNPLHKFTQQDFAARIANVELHLSCFNDVMLQSSAQNVLHSVSARIKGCNSEDRALKNRIDLCRDLLWPKLLSIKNRDTEHDILRRLSPSFLERLNHWMHHRQFAVFLAVVLASLLISMLRAASD